MTHVISTDRLILREINFEDKDELFDLHSDPEVQKFTGEAVVTQMKEIEASIQSRLSDYREYGFGRLAVIEKHTGVFVGWAGLCYLPEFEKVDLGYRFKKEFWGKGYATEVSIAILEHGFRVHELDEIIAIAMPENKASIRVMQKSGMHFDKIAQYDEQITEAVWYSLGRTQFLSNLKA